MCELVTDVLTLYSDVLKTSLVIIGNYRFTRIFPRNLDPTRDFGLFSKFHANTWNKKSIWTSIVTGLNLRAAFQHIKDFNMMKSFSAHAIEYSGYVNWKDVFLYINMASVLQSVDETVGSSFKFSLRRLLLDHIPVALILYHKAILPPPEGNRDKT